MKKETNTNNTDDGFIDIEETSYTAKYKRPCACPQHNPPTMLYVPYGQVYKHICPSCGEVTILHSSMVTL